MPGIDSIVQVNITRGSKTVSRAGFGTPLILGSSASSSTWVERHRVYSSLSGVAADFLVTDTEYKAARSAFSQEIKPAKVMIGRRTAIVAQVSTFTPNVTSQAVQNYVATINGVAYTFVSDASPTASEVVTGLIALINADLTLPVTASGTSTLILTADNAGQGFSASGSTNLSVVATTANHGVAEDVLAVTTESDDWYMLILTSRDANEIMEAAIQVESMKKIFLAATSASDVLTVATTDIGSKLKAANLFRTALVWSADQANYPEAAWAGARLPLDPGSETWKFASLAGITADNLTDSQIANLDTKRVNYFVIVGGVPIMEQGKVAGNEWIDVIRGIDWLEARMKERVFGVLVSVPKVPYTDIGIAMIESPVRAQLSEGVRKGLLSSDPAPTVTVPLVADIDPALRQARTLPDVKFNATLAGAIQDVQISGVVSV